MGRSLRTGHTKSCGCLQKEVLSKIGKLNATHGHNRVNKQSRTHHIWTGMKRRCNNPNDLAYRNYGGRGIIVCERWLKFENFFKDIGEIPEGKELDRINNNGNYTPDNCKLSTRKEQTRNRRTNHLLKYDGKELCFAEWEEVSGIKQATIRYRIKLGWSIKDALTKPVQKHKINKESK
jgi:hypothetical protein